MKKQRKKAAAWSLKDRTTPITITLGELRELIVRGVMTGMHIERATQRKGVS